MFNNGITDMDYSYDLERDVMEMGREELADTFEKAVSELLSETPDLPPPYPPAADVSEQYCPLPYVTNIGQCGGLLQMNDIWQSQAESQGQMTLFDGQSLQYVGWNREPMWYVVDAPPPTTVSRPKKRKREIQQDDEDRPYVKKPPNAFMLYMKEQRPKVKSEIDHRGRGNAAINKALGQRWKSLTKAEQAKYYTLAEQERLIHAQQNPQWSSSHNYGKKRNRKRRIAPTKAEASTSKPEVTVNPPQTPLVESSSSSPQLPLTGAAEPVAAEPVAAEPVYPTVQDCPKAASPSPASADTPAPTMTGSSVSEEDEEYFSSQLEAFIEALGEETHLPPHSDLHTPGYSECNNISQRPEKTMMVSSIFEDIEAQCESSPLKAFLEALGGETHLPPHSDLHTPGYSECNNISQRPEETMMVSSTLEDIKAQCESSPLEAFLEAHGKETHLPPHSDLHTPDYSECYNISRTPEKTMMGFSIFEDVEGRYESAQPEDLLQAFDEETETQLSLGADLSMLSFSEIYGLFD